MIFRSLSSLVIFGLSTPALAASDLVAGVSQTAGTHVYETGRYTVTVSNVGNQTANSASVVIQLPTTHTSPQVYIMGQVTGKSSNCTSSGSRITCTLGSIRKNNSASVYFDMWMPESAAPLTVTATASTSSAENSTANNSGSLNANLANYAVNFTSGAVVNNHCTGTGLTAYYECTLFPSSISAHDATLNSDGSVSFPAEYGPAYGGTWWSDSADHLAFVITESEVVIAEFEGYGVSANCWEGMTTFPGSSYVSPYEVCF